MPHVSSSSSLFYFTLWCLSFNSSSFEFCASSCAAYDLLLAEQLRQRRPRSPSERWDFDERLEAEKKRSSLVIIPVFVLFFSMEQHCSSNYSCFGSDLVTPRVSRQWWFCRRNPKLSLLFSLACISSFSVFFSVFSVSLIYLLFFVSFSCEIVSLSSSLFSCLLTKKDCRRIEWALLRDRMKMWVNRHQIRWQKEEKKVTVHCAISARLCSIVITKRFTWSDTAVITKESVTKSLVT